MKNIKKVLLSVAASVTMAASLAACGSGQPEQTAPEQPKFPDYKEIQLGKEMWEVRFTDSEGVKMRCFVYVGFRKGGLDACEKVG